MRRTPSPAWATPVPCPVWSSCTRSEVASAAAGHPNTTRKLMPSANRRQILVRIVQVSEREGVGHLVRPWADASRKGAGCDPPERPRPPFRNNPPRWDAHRCGSPAPRPVGGIVRGARPWSLRDSSACGPATPSGNRAGSRLGARRDHDVSVPCGGWPCLGRGKSVARSRSARRICCRPGCSGGACRRTRARCGRLCDQGRACCRAGRRGRARRATRVHVAARPTPGRNSRTRHRRQRLRNDICWSVFDC